MIQHCCDARQFFDAKEARSKAKAYRRKGPRGASRRLLKMMQPAVSQGDELLDIGGGIGLIGLELQGLSAYTSVEASIAYRAEAEQLFADQGWRADQLNFHTADFVEIADQIKPHQHLSLDKVICCYPDMPELLRLACSKAERQIGLVYPLSGLIPSVFQRLANFYFRLKKSAFRSYLHPSKKVRAVMEGHGFRCLASHRGIPWRVEVWRRELGQS